MKIMNLLTLRYLKLNKKRTILTILCISVSVIMISCVGIAFYSGQQFYKEYIEKTTGDYHYTFISHNKEFIDIVKNDPDIDEYYFSSTEPYYADENLKEETFLSMKSGDSLYFQKQNYQNYLIVGKLPSHYGEIAISEKYLKSNQIQKTIGDTISLYNNEYHKKYDYQIVGIINNYDSQNINK